MMTSYGSSSSILKKCIEESFDSEMRFSDASFRRKWIDMHGTSLYFLFRKNVRVTNLQHLELGVLLRAHANQSATAGTGNRATVDLRILQTGAFSEEIRELCELHMTSHRRAGRDPESKVISIVAEELVSLYGDIWSRTVVLDQFLCGAAVYAPHGINIDLETMCAASGYVHSVGRMIYAQPVHATSQRGLESSLSDYMNANPITEGVSQRVALIPFAHEDFAETRPEKVAASRNGLADVKLHVTKFYLGSDSLVDVIRRIGEKFGEQISVCPSGHYQESRRRHVESMMIDDQRTIWMIADWELGESPQSRGSRWFICYEQVLGSSSPYEIFDENKFAWVDHTTMPHSMAAALLNLATRTERGVRIVDPFAGSGTVGLETARQNAVVVQLSDADALMPHVWRDNTRVLGYDATELEALLEVVKELIAPGRGSGRDSTADVKQKLLDSFTKKDDVAARAVYYICLRVIRRHAAEMVRSSESQELFERAFRSEQATLYNQLVRLQRLRRKEVLRTFPGTGTVVVRGDYAHEVSVSTEFILGLHAKPFIEQSVGVSMFRSVSADVVITDPPYGFNTSEDPAALARIYRDFVLACLDSKITQAVVCLMAKSFIGNDAPVFTRPDFVERCFELAARDANVVIQRVQQTLPGPAWLVHDRYYWESERALRREVLHFIIRR